MYLTDAEKAALDARIAAIESRVGVEILTAIVGKSDTYNEAPWKAFALGAALAGFAGVVADAWRPDWVSAHASLVAAMTVLGAGATLAGAAILIPGFARLFLRRVRREAEVRHYAEAMFLRREMFRTPERTAILLLVSVFERQVEILADIGVRSELSTAQWTEVIAAMRSHLSGRRPAEALTAGLDRLEALLAAKGRKHRVRDNQFPDAPIEERGA